MRLSRSDFDAAYAGGTLRLAFVGMSNIGKSFTATRLAKSHDFDLIEVDRIIWESLGQGSMADFAAWQGQPYTDNYGPRETQSIAMETDATRKALGLPQTDNALLDTTGSVIYTDEDVLEALKERWLIVHIIAEEKDLERLKSDYFALPKPLIWHGHYAQQDGMTPEESILACYPKLLESRGQAYRDLADVGLPSSFVLDPQTTMDAVMELIAKQLT
ncbi:MAG: hypothetical protein ACPGVT_11555 [Maricaulaceae bacterium]